MYVLKSAMYNTMREAQEAEKVWDSEIAEVEVVPPPTATEQELIALSELCAHFKRYKSTTHTFTGKLTAPTRLVLHAYREALTEIEEAAYNNPEVDVFGGKTHPQAAIDLLKTVIDWGNTNWHHDRSGYMKKTFCLSSLFRKGKWRERATWPDPKGADEW